MADFWIKIEKGTPDKPEILELAEILGIEDPDTVTGKMIRVWSWFDSNSENGHAPSVTNVLLDRLTGVTGFTDALTKVGWLSKTEGGYLITNFDRHLGKSAKKRASDADRKRRSRSSSQECHTNTVTKDVTEKGLDKSRVDKSNKDLLSETSSDPLDELAETILEYFNVTTGSNLKKTTQSHIGFIKARLKDGYQAEDLILVIDCKQAQWGGNPEKAQYVRPSTLFRPGNFDGYLKSARLQVKSGSPVVAENVKLSPSERFRQRHGG